MKSALHHAVTVAHLSLLEALNELGGDTPTIHEHVEHALAHLLECLIELGGPGQGMTVDDLHAALLDPSLNIDRVTAARIKRAIEAHMVLAPFRFPRK